MANQIEEAVRGALKTSTEVTAHVLHAAQGPISLAHRLNPSRPQSQGAHVDVAHIQACRAQNGHGRRAAGTEVDAVGEAAGLDVDVNCDDSFKEEIYREHRHAIWHLGEVWAAAIPQTNYFIL